MSKPDIVEQLCDLHSDLHREMECKTGIHTFYADKLQAMASLVLDAATVADKYARLTEGPAGAKYKRGDRLRKTRGSEWQGRVVGFYSTELTPIGYCIESEFHRGSVQIYPEDALEPEPGGENG